MTSWRDPGTKRENLFNYSFSMPGCPSLVVHPGASKSLRSIYSMAVILTVWLMPRYGYHFPLYFLILAIINCVAAVCGLVNILLPGKDVTLCSLVSKWNDIISGTLHLPTVNQWILTIGILTALAAIPFYVCNALLNPVTNLADWAFFSIPTVSMSMLLWFLCKYYVDAYVKLDKI